MTGYVRQSSNDIASGKQATASSVNDEFNALEAAFNSVTGHNHDGTSGGGVAIQTLGPLQEFNVTTTAAQPKDDNTLDLGTDVRKWKDVHVAGSVIGNVTGNVTGNLTGNVTGNASTASSWETTRTITIGSTGKGVNGSANVSWTLSEIGAAAQSHTHSVDDITTGTFPVSKGGTGRSFLTSGSIILGAGTGQVGQLVGSASGQIPIWNGSTWSVDTLPASGVLSVTATAPLTSSGGSNPDISLTGAIPINKGGTSSTTSPGARNSLGLGSMATQNSNNVNITGGTISNVSLSTSPPTTNEVLSATAGASFGAVGTYVLGRSTANFNSNPGNTLAGSSLRAGSAAGLTTTTLSGTWRAMGATNPGTGPEETTLWLRIS